MLDRIQSSNGFALSRPDVRKLETPDGTRGWLIPGSGTACFAAEDAEGIGMACGTTEQALQGKLIIVQHSTRTGDDLVIGLAPDDATAVQATTDTGRAAATVSGNMYVDRGRNISQIKVSHADGTSVSITAR